jgi:hypothetical protein
MKEGELMLTTALSVLYSSAGQDRARDAQGAGAVKALVSPQLRSNWYCELKPVGRTVDHTGTRWRFTGPCRLE